MLEVRNIVCRIPVRETEGPVGRRNDVGNVVLRLDNVLLRLSWPCNARRREDIGWSGGVGCVVDNEGTLDGVYRQ